MTSFFKTLLPPELPSEKNFGRYEAGVILVACLGLIFIEFMGGELRFRQFFGDLLLDYATYPTEYERVQALKSHPWYKLLALTHWATCCAIGYMLIPSLYIVATKQKLTSLHLSFKGTLEHRGIYGILLLIMLPPVVLVSSWENYQNIYPFYDHAGRSVLDLLVWEFLYLGQFLALEYFFRGFMVSQLRPWAGSGSIFIMLIPYCMIHFPKTASETIGALIAGVVLGSLALRGRSIWGGVILHCSVALTMDLLCLYHSGALKRLLE